MFGRDKKDGEVAAQNQEAAESGNNYTGPADIETTDGKAPFVGAPDDARNNVAATEEEKAAIAPPPPQPPIDNDHVAEGAEKFSDETIAANATPTTEPVPAAPINFEHRFNHFKNAFEEEMHELLDTFKADYKALIAKFHARVHGAD